MIRWPVFVRPDILDEGVATVLRVMLETLHSLEDLVLRVSNSSVHLFLSQGKSVHKYTYKGWNIEKLNRFIIKLEDFANIWTWNVINLGGGKVGVNKYSLLISEDFFGQLQLNEMISHVLILKSPKSLKESFFIEPRSTLISSELYICSQIKLLKSMFVNFNLYNHRECVFWLTGIMCSIFVSLSVISTELIRKDKTSWATVLNLLIIQTFFFIFQIIKESL